MKGFIERAHIEEIVMKVIIIVKEVYQFSQSIARQKIKKITIASHNGNMINLTV